MVNMKSLYNYSIILPVKSLPKLLNRKNLQEKLPKVFLVDYSCNFYSGCFNNFQNGIANFRADTIAFSNCNCFHD